MSLLNLNGVCGVPDYKTPAGVSLIKKGRPAVRGQFPWLVAYFYGERKKELVCGGSLISSKIVVTAAHCIKGKGSSSAQHIPKNSLFYLGKIDLDSSTDDTYQTNSVASEFHIHPEWNPNDPKYGGDIAIAVLMTIINFNRYVKPICIWRDTRSSLDIHGQYGLVAGWGKTEFDAISTSEPLYVKVPAVSPLKCILSNNMLSSIVSESSFCAGVKGSNEGACNGDSGKSMAV